MPLVPDTSAPALARQPASAIFGRLKLERHGANSRTHLGIGHAWSRAGPPARVESGPPIPARRFRPVDSGQPAAAGRHYISRLKRRRIVAATWGLAVANGVRSGAATVRRERALIPRPMDFEPGSGCRRVLCAMLPPPARSPLSLREEKGPGPVLRDVGPRGLVLCVHAISAVHDARSWSSCR